MMTLTEELAKSCGVVTACEKLDVARSMVYRFRRPAADDAAPSRFQVRRAPPRALSQAECEEIIALLNSERFQDMSPREVYAQLLDEGKYMGSWRTFYRILHGHEQVRERRNQRRHPVYKKPELLATGPNQVWSWDITVLRGSQKGVYYYLYVMIDIFSRYVVGWMIAEVETAELAERLIAKSYVKQEVQPGQLTIHADNGAPMTARSVAALLKNLSVGKSHSRPHVSNDNPYSESHFKTLKYRPDYPDRFASLDAARQWARSFFDWYNNQHHHTGLGLLTPAAVHTGQADTLRQQRQAVLQQAFAAHPERFVRGVPQPDKLPSTVWINPPQAHPGQPSVSEAPESSASADQPTTNASDVEVTGPVTTTTLADLPMSKYTPTCGTEDSATLESDMSAVPVKGVTGRSRHSLEALPIKSPQSESHLCQSEKLKRSRPRARLKPAPIAVGSSPLPATPQTCTLISAPDLSQDHCHIPHHVRQHLAGDPEPRHGGFDTQYAERHHDYEPGWSDSRVQHHRRFPAGHHPGRLLRRADRRRRPADLGDRH